MAYDKENRRLYVDESSDKGGIALWQIADCLRYYKRDTNGRRNLGTIIKNADINKWAKYKPFRSSAPIFETKEDKEFAMKAANAGLLIPNGINAGITTAAADYKRIYLGELAYRASHGAAPNYEYMRPRGLDPNGAYDERFRALDFDGYNHLATTPPFTTAITNVAVQDGKTRVSINRFEENSLQCVLQRLANAELDIADLFYGEDHSQYYFSVEVYKQASFAGYDSYAPDVVYRADSPVSELGASNISQLITIVLDDADMDNKNFDVVLGINRYMTDPNHQIPDDARVGFVCPWSEGYYPFVYSFRQEYYAVFDIIQEAGYYIASASTADYTSFNTKDYNDLTYKKSYSDKVGLALQFKRKAEDYYIVGANANANAIPANGFKVWIRAVVRTTSGERYINATVANSDIGSDKVTTGTNYTTVYSSQDEYQTIYLRFDGMMPTIGEKIGYITLEFSTDGTTYSTIGNVSTGHDGSSVKLYLERV